jgi:hypothetical protein
MRIHELLEPKKPESKVKSATLSKSGLQGSTNKIAQRTFTTNKGNQVDIQFKTTTEDNVKATDVVFYVNGTMYDNSSTEGKDIDNDFDILSGVGYIVKTYLDKAKIDRCTFSAHSTSSDTKHKFNIPVERPKRELIASLQGLSSVTNELLKTEQDEIRNKKYNIVLETIEAIKQYLTQPVENYSSRDFDKLYWQMRNAVDMKLSKYPEMNEVFKQLERFISVIASYSPEGVHIRQNRRFQVYSKILNKFFASTWNIETYGDNFILTRKTGGV